MTNLATALWLLRGAVRKALASGASVETIREAVDEALTDA